MSEHVLRISSGLGPVEVRRFVGALADALAARVVALGARVTDVTVHGEAHAPRSIDLGIEGPCERLGMLVGTHALIAPSRGARARKRWFASVALAPRAQTPSIAVTRDELSVEACRARGKGGQHVNKTSSAVRVLHRPSGVQVRVESERSQHRNLAIARARIAEALARRAEEHDADARAQRRRASLMVERGRPVAIWRHVGGKLVKEARHA